MTISTNDCFQVCLLKRVWIFNSETGLTSFIPSFIITIMFYYVGLLSNIIWKIKDSKHYFLNNNELTLHFMSSPITDGILREHSYYWLFKISKWFRFGLLYTFPSLLKQTNMSNKDWGNSFIPKGGITTAATLHILISNVIFPIYFIVTRKTTTTTKQTTAISTIVTWSCYTGNVIILNTISFWGGHGKNWK